MIDTVHVDDVQIHAAGAGDRAVIALNGLFGTPSPRADVFVRPRAHGARDYTEFYGPKVVEAVGVVTGATPAAAMLELDAIRALFSLNSADRTLRFRRSGFAFDEQVSFRVASELAAPLAGLRRTVRYSVSLFVPDPRIYATIEQTDFYSPNSTSGGGISFPVAFPLTFTGASGAASMVVTNGGTFPTPPVYTILGPANTPEIVNETTGESIALTGAIIGGDTLIIDVPRRRVTLNGTERFDLIDPTSNIWAELPPGESVLRLGGSGFSDGVTRLAVAFRDARI